jgi:hypothetical protein
MRCFSRIQLERIEVIYTKTPTLTYVKMSSLDFDTVLHKAEKDRMEFLMEYTRNTQREN